MMGKRMRANKSWVKIVILFCVVSINVFTGCGGGDTPEDQIRQFVAVGEQATEERNIAGIKKLVSEQYASGEYMVKWNGRDDVGTEVVSGVYLYRFSAGDFVDRRKHTC